MKQAKALFFILSCFLMVFSLHSQDFTYVGAQKCKICHKAEKLGKQFLIWEDSKHSKAYEVLSSESALETAKERQLKKPPSESPECLKCHGPLSEKASEIVAEGVTCEVCHGPGGTYKKLSFMKNRDVAAKNGLVLYASTDAIKTQCLTCHDAKTFDFDSSWEKIKHSIPGKE
jgi:hypothetical protein